ncbi:TonB-dependent receptor [Spongiibacter taiwanensis]|uniref:TonB-dependent receptor n=1 Tax=Spongiibacter taiwanensis TaxID=1748242 RepID=UPI002035BBF4|nr:TonB-dependent receptor [Spongiibacter taiwanensis]USA44758.1 TonB-dependent receptor [Spongiibacter taiwanensis]
MVVFPAPALAGSGYSRIPEEILVTARKREELGTSVPVAISVFSGDELRKLGLRDVRGLDAFVPGLTVSDSGFNTPVFTLRGVGFNDVTYTASPAVGLYIDEFSLPYSIMAKGPLLDIEGVEVLKGPQGLFFGRNATGGAINLRRHRPTELVEGEVSFSYGRFERTEVSAVLSGPLTDTLQGRIAVQDSRSQQGWQISNTRPGDRLGKEDRQALRAMLTWQASDALDIELAVDTWSDRGEPQAAQAIYYNAQLVNAPPQRAEDYPFIDPTSRNNRLADWPAEQGAPFVEWQLDDRFRLFTLRADWLLADNVRLSNLVSHIKMVSDESKIAQTGFDFDNSEQDISASIHSLGLESRLSGEWRDGDVNAMAGVNYSRDRGHEYHRQYIGYQSAALASPATGGRSLSDKIFFVGDNLVTQWAGFANVQWQLGPALSVSLGARHTRQKHFFTGCAGDDPEVQTLGPGVPTFIGAVFPTVSQATAASYEQETGQPGDPQFSTTPGECVTVAENGSFDPFADTLDEQNTSYRVTLQWQPDQGQMWYLSAGRSFKAGSFPVLTAASQAQLEPVTQEALDAWEWGGKFSLFQEQLRPEFAVYSYRYTDKQLLAKVRDPIFGPLPVLRNVPDSAVLGAELSARYLPNAVKSLALVAAVSYTDTEVRRYRGYNTDGSDPDFDYAGRRFNFAPLWEYNLLVSYQWQLGGQNWLRASLDYAFKDETNSTLDGDPWYRHDDHGLLGASLTFGDQQARWELAAFVRNITDEFVTRSVFRNGDGVSRLTGMPRTYGVSVRYRLP